MVEAIKLVKHARHIHRPMGQGCVRHPLVPLLRRTVGLQGEQLQAIPHPHLPVHAPRQGPNPRAGGEHGPRPPLVGALPKRALQQLAPQPAASQGHNSLLLPGDLNPGKHTQARRPRTHGQQRPGGQDGGFGPGRRIQGPANATSATAGARAAAGPCKHRGDGGPNHQWHLPGAWEMLDPITQTRATNPPSASSANGPAMSSRSAGASAATSTSPARTRRRRREASKEEEETRRRSARRKARTGRLTTMWPLSPSPTHLFHDPPVGHPPPRNETGSRTQRSM